MPVLCRAAGPGGSHLPAGERVPALTTFAGLAETDALDLLARGEVEVVGRLVDASNATLYSEVCLDGVRRACVYKPAAGERPLWDFPTGTLARREAAAYELSASSGWCVVPPTVLRQDAPAGPGSLQLWIGPAAGESAEPGAGLVDVLPRDRVPPGWLSVLRAVDAEGEPVVLAHADDERLRRMAVLDVVCNNADRKGGHVLAGDGGQVHGCDHGLTFNEEGKLRTVLWGWAGRRLQETERAVLSALLGALAGDLGHRLADLLSTAEVRRTQQRVDALLRHDRMPRPGAGWPPIPWPAF